MNLLKKAMNASLLCVVLLGCIQGYAQKKALKKAESVAIENIAPFHLNEVNFQEWYAGINVGGTGFNIFLPNITNDEQVILEAIYFRNLTGKLIKGKGLYSAVLKNSSLDYTWEYPEKPTDYPFDLTPDECVVSYTENGQLKYYKISSVIEKAGTYYENGPPAVYQNEPFTSLATVEED